MKDTIYVMKNGSIIEDGDFQHVKTTSVYKDFIASMKEAWKTMKLWL